MAYEPTEWKSGDVVTSAKLNKIEQGVAGAGGGLVVTATIEGETKTLNKTWQEMFDALSAGNQVVIKVGDDYASAIATVYYTEEDGYAVLGDAFYNVDSASGYPATSGGN